ncbi:MAG: segregation and condensation protein A [Dethiobacteria bacterium]
MSSIIKPKEGDEKGHCHIILPVFEGPFDLLFYLVHKEELDVHEIPLGKITQQYLQYLQSMQELQIEVAGEFLVMAASLLCLKSRLLLPQHPFSLSAGEEEIFFFGSKEELVRSLLEYKRFKLAATILKERKNRQERIYLRPSASRSYVLENKYSRLYPADLESLKKAWIKLKEKNNPEDNKMKTIFFAPKTSFVRILRWVVTSLRKNTFFNSYLDDFGVKGTREERVSIFTLFLELARRGRLSLWQEKAFSRIRILKPSGKRRKSTYAAKESRATVDNNGHH